MAQRGRPVPTVPDEVQSSVHVSGTNCPVGSAVQIHLMLLGSRGNPMVGGGIMSSVDALVVKPSGQTARIQFPAQVPAGGKCASKFPLFDVGVHTITVKICGRNIKNSPLKVFAIVRGRQLKVYRPPMNQPHDILQRDNVFVVTDKGSNQVQVFDHDFRPANKFCSPEMPDMSKFDPYAIAWTGQTFVVTDLQNHRVVEFKNFVPFQVFGGETLQQPTGIAAGNHRRVYVADGMKHCIFVFDEHRECVSIIGGQGVAPGQLNSPWFLAMNTEEHLVVADFKNHRVQILDPRNNKPVRVIKVNHNGKTWDCRGLALDKNNNIYVSVRSGFMRGFSVEMVLVYSPMGDFLGNFGEGFNYVRGLTVTYQGQKTNVHVVDGANNRIIAYEM